MQNIATVKATQHPNISQYFFITTTPLNDYNIAKNLNLLSDRTDSVVQVEVFVGRVIAVILHKDLTFPLLNF